MNIITAKGIKPLRDFLVSEP